MKKILLAISFFLAAVSAANGQTTTNPTTVSFTASVDHSTVINGTPVLDHYDLNLISSNPSGVIAFTQGLGKPTPGASNVITSTLSSGFLGAMQKNQLYSATVASVGNGGTSTSTASNPFYAPAAPAAATNVSVR